MASPLTTGAAGSRIRSPRNRSLLPSRSSCLSPNMLLSTDAFVGKRASTHAPAWGATPWDPTASVLLRSSSHSIPPDPTDPQEAPAPASTHTRAKTPDTHAWADPTASGSPCPASPGSDGRLPSPARQDPPPQLDTRTSPVHTGPAPSHPFGHRCLYTPSDPTDRPSAARTALPLRARYPG